MSFESWPGLLDETPFGPAGAMLSFVTRVDVIVAEVVGGEGVVAGNPSFFRENRFSECVGQRCECGGTKIANEGPSVYGTHAITPRQPRTCSCRNRSPA